MDPRHHPPDSYQREIHREQCVAEECFQRYGAHPRISLGQEALHRALLPFVEGFRRKVSPRGAIRCNKKNYYSRELRPFHGQYVDVRYDEDKPTEVYAYPPGRERTIVCQIYGRGFDDQEVLEAAKRFDAAKVSPITDVPYADAAKALFAEKLDATQERLKAEKAKRSKRPQKPKPVPPTPLATVSETDFVPKFNFESFNA